MPRPSSAVRFGQAAGLLVLSVGPALAQSPADSATPPAESSTWLPSEIWRRDRLLGTMGGLRTRLDRYGISLGLQETDEVLGNLSGGTKQSAAYEGLTVMSLGIDTQKAFGWEGGTLNISGLQIHGQNLVTDNHLLILQTPSGIAAERITRLWELWYRQEFLNGAVDIKIGQQSLDLEFMTSQGSGLFMNAAMGWPVLPAADMYGGGPAYPLSSLGVRLRGQPARNVTVLGGVFDDNPPGGPFGDDGQLRGAERYGTRFSFNTGALFIVEVQYAINQPAEGDMVTAPAAGGLPGTYKLGGWYDSGAFLSQRFDTIGLTLADPASSGSPSMLHGNWSIYAVADQMVWRSDPEGPRAIGVFARMMGGPADRNLVSFSVNAGVTLKAPFSGRDNDTAGIGFGFAKISGSAIAFERDSNAFPIRSSETFIEVTYQAQITPWLQVQPDFEYVFNPGGGVPDPSDPARRLGNAAILGLRTNIVF